MNNTKTISFLDTKNGDFSLINGVVISSKSSFEAIDSFLKDIGEDM